MVGNSFEAMLTELQNLAMQMNERFLHVEVDWQPKRVVPSATSTICPMKGASEATSNYNWSNPTSMQRSTLSLMSRSSEVR